MTTTPQSVQAARDLLTKHENAHVAIGHLRAAQASLNQYAIALAESGLETRLALYDLAALEDIENLIEDATSDPDETPAQVAARVNDALATLVLNGATFSLSVPVEVWEAFQDSVADGLREAGIPTVNDETPED